MYLIDEVIKQRLDEILPQKLEKKLAKPKANNDHHRHEEPLDWAYTPFIPVVHCSRDRRRAPTTRALSCGTTTFD